MAEPLYHVYIGIMAYGGGQPPDKRHWATFGSSSHFSISSEEEEVNYDRSAHRRGAESRGGDSSPADTAPSSGADSPGCAKKAARGMSSFEVTEKVTGTRRRRNWGMACGATASLAASAALGGLVGHYLSSSSSDNSRACSREGSSSAQSATSRRSVEMEANRLGLTVVPQSVMQDDYIKSRVVEAYRTWGEGSDDETYPHSPEGGEFTTPSGPYPSSSRPPGRGRGKGKKNPSTRAPRKRGGRRRGDDNAGPSGDAPW